MTTCHQMRHGKTQRRDSTLRYEFLYPLYVAAQPYKAGRNTVERLDATRYGDIQQSGAILLYLVGRDLAARQETYET